jgi:hypothetical protein
MQNVQSVNLILRTADLISTWSGTDINQASNPYRYTPNSTGTIGFKKPDSFSGGFPVFVLNNNNTNWTWTNISLRNLLGDLYDNYERFNLILESVSQGQAYGTDGQATQLAFTAEDLRTMINITGLPFVNNYNTLTKMKTNVVRCAQLTILKANTNITYFNQHFCATFDKSQETADINIFLTRANDGQQLYTGAQSLYPHLTFNFQIVGIPNKSIEGNFTPASRIDKGTGKI